MIQVLVPLTISWKPSSNGSVPAGAVEAGATADGEKLYIGRVSHDGSTTPGKVLVAFASRDQILEIIPDHFCVLD